MIALLILLLRLLALPSRPQCQLEAENAALKHQLAILHRKQRGRVQLTNIELIRAGLLEEVCAHGSLLAWRRDAAAGPMALRITRKGFEAVGVKDDAVGGSDGDKHLCDCC